MSKYTLHKMKKLSIIMAIFLTLRVSKIKTKTKNTEDINSSDTDHKLF